MNFEALFNLPHTPPSIDYAGQFRVRARIAIFGSFPFCRPG